MRDKHIHIHRSGDNKKGGNLKCDYAPLDWDDILQGVLTAVLIMIILGLWKYWIIWLFIAAYFFVEIEDSKDSLFYNDGDL